MNKINDQINEQNNQNDQINEQINYQMESQITNHTNYLINERAIYFKNVWHFIAQGFGSGCSPKAPGTCGSLVAMLFVPALWLLPWQIYFLLVVAGFVFGIWLCNKVAKDLNNDDPGSIVWDEFVGIWLTYFFIPADWLWLGVGFLLFRLFDILKPFPINFLDANIKGGFGIMLDDVIAGISSCVCLHLLIKLVAMF